jgi:hypothetical protein
MSAILKLQKIKIQQLKLIHYENTNFSITSYTIH